MLDKTAALSGALCAEGCYATLPNTVMVPQHQQSTVKDDSGGDISVHGVQPVRQQLLYADEQSGVSGCDPLPITIGTTSLLYSVHNII